VRRRFCLVLIKPSHYDDDGYVIQWFRSAIPSNSLAALYGLADDCARRRALGDDVEIDIHAFDETNTSIRPDRLAAMIREAAQGMVMLVGVQSNQFPRALDIARALRERGIQVAIGGFHVSGVISMLQGADPDLDRAKALGVSLFAGEAEGHLDEVLRDASIGRLKPLYDFMDDLPGIEGEPAPLITASKARRTFGNVTSFDAGRGCPYQCSFCTIINVQGRKSRSRSPDDVENIVRANLAQGLRSFFITDDNFARNRKWEAILDRLIHLREVEELKFGLIIQVDTLCHRIPNFVDKCRRAGVRRVFIGLENINPANLMAAKKRQNRITEYRQMLLAWKSARVITYAGYIIGFPNDTIESIQHDIDVIKKELPIDLLEFFQLTPLPGSEDHQKLHRAGIAMDPDMNNYDTNHVTTAHPRMSRAQWERAYQLAWRRYYTTEHITTVLRRAAATQCNVGNTLFLLAWFKGSIDYERIHPLEGGFLRLKSRRNRRPGLAPKSVWLFYPKYIAETAVKLVQWCTLYLRLRAIYHDVKRDQRQRGYIDLAITPLAEDEAETRELFQTEAAQAYVSQQRRLQDMRAG
jgi:Radical SAM superfamily